ILSLRGTDNAVYQIIGADSYILLKPELKTDPNHRWIIVPRDGAGTDELAEASRRGAVILPLPEADGASSGRLRADLKSGRYDSPLLNPKVGDYIRKNSLYRPLPDELIPVQQGIFNEAYSEALKDIHVADPSLDLSNLNEPPAFLPTQSRLGWAESFILSM